MITLLRRIREKLIGEGNLRKYLLYAFGEIFLVVIGILIALQVNNWNQQQNNQQVSAEYHGRMISDLEQIIQLVNREIQRADGIQEKLSKSVLILENKQFNDSTKKILDTALDRYYQLTTLSFQITSYEEMKSTGRLNLVYNVELRQLLNRYEKQAYYTEGIVSQLSETLNNGKDKVIPYVRVYLSEESRSITYDKQEIAEDPVLINTLADFAYEWFTYKYFLNDMLDNMINVKEQLELEVQKSAV